MDITAAQIDRYTNGHCHSLAQAITNLTGWQMVLWSNDDGVTGHVTVRTPNGTYLDAVGVHTTAEMLNSGWSADSATHVRSAYSLGWEDPDINGDTHAVAGALLDSIRA